MVEELYDLDTRRTRSRGVVPLWNDILSDLERQPLELVNALGEYKPSPYSRDTLLTVFTDRYGLSFSRAPPMTTCVYSGTDNGTDGASDAGQLGSGAVIHSGTTLGPSHDVVGACSRASSSMELKNILKFSEFTLYK